MPDVQVFHLTDFGTPIVEGAIGMRIPEPMPMAVRRITHHSRLTGDWLFIDTDCIVQKDVQHVFDDDFQVAVTDRKGSLWEKTAFGEQMPWNMGVTFSRSPDFWKTVLKNLLTLPTKEQHWMGDQMIVCAMVKAGFPVKELPGHIYNFTPENRGDSAEHAAIVHLKGPRKAWIDDYT